jgi:hypothetical protein
MYNSLGKIQLRAESFFIELTRVLYIETTEGWPLLTVETGANGDSWRTDERAPVSVGLLGSSFRYNRFLSPCLGCSGQPSTKYFSLSAHYFTFFVTQLSRQTAVSGHLSLNMCLWFHGGGGV